MESIRTALELALWYSGKAKLFWRQAEEQFREFKYPECASSYEESIEFAAKAICEFNLQGYDWKHGVSDGLIHLSAITPDLKLQFSRAAWISSRWVGMEQRARTLVRYGNQEAKVPATLIVGKKDVEPLKQDAYEICQLLCKVEFEKKFKKTIKMGLLNGRVDQLNDSEKPCVSYPFNEFKDLSIWRDRFLTILSSGESKYSIEEISVSQIRNDFALILNPFGEAYPENDTRRRFSFNLLKNYIADGGVLVTTGGFPFFYAWDVNNGKEEAIVDEKVIIPEPVSSEEGKGTGVAQQFKVLLSFAGSLLWREFEVLPTSDTPIYQGIKALDCYQNDEDKKIAGDLKNVGGDTKVNEFRSLRKGSKNILPMLRTTRPDFGEVYPIVAVKFGLGYLICAGMHLKTAAEFEKLVVSVDNFCSWLQKGE